MSLGINNHITGASQDVLQAIQNASRKTGVDFDYLVNQARTESSFRTDVKASTSSATGLYQFIDQTWLSMVSKYGSKHDLDDMASQVKQDFQGRFYVANDTLRQEILNLRKNPDIASLMAAELASGNGTIVQTKTGKNPSATDLYMAHFLGASGASNFIKAMQDDPYRPAAFLFPSAASSNKNVFYNSDGSPKTLEQIYKTFAGKFNNVTEGQMVHNDAVQQTKAIANNQYTRDIQFERLYGDTVANFVRDMPSVSGFESGSFFEGIYGQKMSDIMQKSISQNALFLTLTMLD